MRFDITRQPLSITVSIFSLLLILFWSRYLFFPLQIETIVGIQMPLGALIDDFCGSLGAVSALIIMLVVFLNAIMITRIVTGYMILATRTYLPTLVYLTVSCGIYVSGASLSVFLSALIIINAMGLLIGGFKRTINFDKFFRGAFLIGFTPLLYAPSAVMMLVVPATLIIFNRSGREILVSIIGLLLPLAFCSYVYWGMGESILYIAHQLYEIISINTPYAILNDNLAIARVVVISILVMLTFLSIGAFIAHARDMRTLAYRVYIAFIYMLLISMLMLLLPCNGITSLAIVAIPLSVIIPTFFVKNTGTLPAMLYFLMIMSVVVLNAISFFI